MPRSEARVKTEHQDETKADTSARAHNPRTRPAGTDLANRATRAVGDGADGDGPLALVDPRLRERAPEPPARREQRVAAVTATAAAAAAAAARLAATVVGDVGRRRRRRTAAALADSIVVGSRMGATAAAVRVVVTDAVCAVAARDAP